MPQKLAPEIVFENPDFLLLNKPSGMVTNRALSTKNIYTVQDWLKDYLGEKVLPWSLRLGLLHRLDKDTCGLLLTAKTKTSYHHFLALFKERQIEKKYIALVHGKLSPSAGDIRLPIKRDSRNRKKFAVFVGGRMSLTEYKTIKLFQNPKEKNRSKKYFSLLDINLKTGRTHQIRVHFNHLHHPLVADEIYGGKKTKRHDLVWCPHLFLQSYFLSFLDIDGKSHEFKLKLSDELKYAIEQKLQEIKE